MEKITGIIIKVVNYRDHDRIVTILCSDNSHKSVLVRGVRNLKSKRASAVQLFNQVSCEVKRTSNTMYSLVNIKVIDYYQDFKNDYQTFVFYNYFFELIFKTHFNTDEFYKFYDYLMLIIKKNRTGTKTVYLRFLFDLEVLKCLGLAPQIKHCACCANTEIVTLDAKSGGYICQACLTTQMRFFSKKTLVVLRRLVDCNLNELNSIKISSETEQELTLFFNEYMLYNIDFKINSLRFIN